MRRSMRSKSRWTNRNRSDTETIYGFATAWAGRIQVNTGDWNAIADMPKVQALLMRVVSIDPVNTTTAARIMYLGVLINSLRPASLGGKPEEGKAEFRKGAGAVAGQEPDGARALCASFTRG